MQLRNSISSSAMKSEKDPLILDKELQLESKKDIIKSLSFNIITKREG